MKYILFAKDIFHMYVFQEDNIYQVQLNTYKRYSWIFSVLHKRKQKDYIKMDYQLWGITAALIGLHVVWYKIQCRIPEEDRRPHPFVRVYQQIMKKDST